jgi:hypothetical protein
MIGEILEGGLHISTLPDGKRLILSPKVYEKKLAYSDISMFESFLIIDDYNEWFVPDADFMKYILQHYAIIKDDMIDGYDMHLDEEYWTVNDTNPDYGLTISFYYKGMMYYQNSRDKKKQFYVRAFKMI